MRHRRPGIFCKVVFRLGAASACAGAASVAPRTPHVLLLHASRRHLSASRTQPCGCRALALCRSSGRWLEAARCQRVAGGALPTKGVACAKVTTSTFAALRCLGS
jgi:hypothetical protein